MPSVRPIILAAGAGSRYGHNKAYARLPSGQTFLSCILETLQEARRRATILLEPWTVIGAEATRVRQLHPHHQGWIENPDWATTDMRASLLCAVEQLKSGDAALIWPVDAPHRHSDIIESMLQEFQDKNLKSNILPTSNGAPGHPVLASHQALIALRRYEHLRAALRATESTWMPFEERPSIARNINTFQDLISEKQRDT